MARDSFVRGAMILAFGLGLTKLLGFYRLVLPRVIGSEGVGLFNYAYPVYSIVLVLSTAGIPVAISKLVAEKQARGDTAGAARIFSVSCWLLAAFGLVFSSVLMYSAPFIAEHVSRDPRAYYPLISIAPAVFFVSLMSAFRGLFQGLQLMTPAANSYVVEQVVRVGTLFVLAFALLPRGIEFAAAGATFGAVTGGVAGLTYLVYEYHRHGLNRAVAAQSGNDPSWQVIRSILHLAIPISLAGLVFPIMQNIDLVIVPYALQSAGLDSGAATALYGQLSGEAMPVVYMPTVFTTALAFSLVPAVSEASAVGNRLLVRSRTAVALRVTMAFAIPVTTGTYLLATDICRLLYDNPAVGPILAAVSAGVLFLAVQQTTSGILQGLGRTDVPVKNLVAGAIAKLVTTAGLMLYLGIGIQGAAYGTVVGFLIAAALNLTSAYRLTSLDVSAGSLVLKPVAATIVMGLAVSGIMRFLPAAGLSLNWSTLVAIGAGGVIYGIVLLLIGGVKERDLDAVPRYGKRISRLLKRWRLLRG